jgi:hypothetical protein
MAVAGTLRLRQPFNVTTPNWHSAIDFVKLLAHSVAYSSSEAAYRFTELPRLSTSRAPCAVGSGVGVGEVGASLRIRRDVQNSSIPGE